MTPYAKVCTRLTVLRERELAHWDGRLAVGAAAKAKMAAYQQDVIDWILRLRKEAAELKAGRWDIEAAAIRAMNFIRGQS